MQYQNCAAAAQPPQGARSEAEARRLTDANINPATGLATDYLNHFNEAIMLLEMLSSFPDCRNDFLAWRPMSYRQHFGASGFNGRDLAIAAYDAAEPALRQRLDTLADLMNTRLEDARVAIGALPADAAVSVAARTAAAVRPLAARALAVINGQPEAGAEAPQATIDGLMKA